MTAVSWELVMAPRRGPVELRQCKDGGGTGEAVGLSRARWDFISDVARRARPGHGEWKRGANPLDRRAGEELCVLVIACQHAEAPEACSLIGRRWAALQPSERWWLYSQIEMDAAVGLSGWQRAVAAALAPTT